MELFVHLKSKSDILYFLIADSINEGSFVLFFVLSALLIPPEHEGFGVLDLMWIVIVSDYVLKLATVLVKTIITLMPHSFMHYQNRVRYLLLFFPHLQPCIYSFYHIL